MPDDDGIAILADDANGILNLLAFHLRRESLRVFGGEHASAQPQHRRLETKPCARGRLVEQAGEDFILIVEGAAARHDAFHQARTVEQLHQQRHGELLRLDNMLQTHVAAPGTCMVQFRRWFHDLHNLHRNVGNASSSKSSCPTSSRSRMIWVAAEPVTASHKCSKDVITASLPPHCKKRSTDSTLGPMLPGGKCPAWWCSSNSPAVTRVSGVWPGLL